MAEIRKLLMMTCMADEIKAHSPDTYERRDHIRRHIMILQNASNDRARIGYEL